MKIILILFLASRASAGTRFDAGPSGPSQSAGADTTAVHKAGGTGEAMTGTLEANAGVNTSTVNASGAITGGSITSRGNMSATYGITAATVTATQNVTTSSLTVLSSASAAGWTVTGDGFTASSGTIRGNLEVSSATLLVNGNAGMAFRIGIDSFTFDSSGQLIIHVASPIVSNTGVLIGTGTSGGLNVGVIAVTTTTGIGFMHINTMQTGGGILSLHKQALPFTGQGLGAVFMGSARGAAANSVVNQAGIEGVAETDWSTTDRATFLRFATTNVGATGRTTKVVIASSGTVGIGTTYPRNGVHVSSSPIPGEASFQADGDAAFSYRAGVSSFVVTGGGGVGINTSTPAYHLDVEGVTRSLNLISVGSTTILGPNAGTALEISNNGTARNAVILSNDNKVVWRNTSNTTVNSEIIGTNSGNNMLLGYPSVGRFILQDYANAVAAITATGGTTPRVGIGTTNPSTLLHVSSGTTNLSGSGSGLVISTGTLPGAVWNAHYSTVSALDFGATAAQTCDAITVTGEGLNGCQVDSGGTAGHMVWLGAPASAADNTKCHFTAYVSAVNAVTVQRCNVAASACTNPAVAMFRISCVGTGAQ